MVILRNTLLSSRPAFTSAACLQCYWRSFQTSHIFQADKPPPPDATNGPAVKIAPPPPTVLSKAPKAYGKQSDELKGFVLEPLDRPVGLTSPPRSGTNTGIDNRTWRQRRADFVDYDKHLVRRKELTTKMSTPYYREWKNMNYHKGKTFLAPPRLFKGDLALYFPNFYGETLLKKGTWRDTTPVINGKVSIVSVYSTTWGMNQAASFTSPEANPELHELVNSSGGKAQFVDLNLEDNTLKAWMVKLFFGGLRKKRDVESWGKYFLVRNTISMDMRDKIGLLNSKVGYTYLLDEDCKIRWAASGSSHEGEKEGLVKGVRRLLQDSKKKRFTISPKEDEAVVEPKVAATAT